MYQNIPLILNFPKLNLHIQVDHKFVKDIVAPIVFLILWYKDHYISADTDINTDMFLYTLCLLMRSLLWYIESFPNT